MGDYSRFISDARRPVPAPERLAGPDGRCVFGTFSSEIAELNLVSAANPTAAPQFMNRLRLTLWEACEICFKEGVLLTGVCNMGVFGVVVAVFYDKRSCRAYQWSVNTPGRRAVIAPNLLGGSVTEGRGDEGFVRFENNFGNGKCAVCGDLRDKSGRRAVYDFSLSRISEPSVVSIPFGPNRPLYSQKDFFRARGRVTVNGETFESDGDTVAIVDDHKGYYPRRAHYDWVTAMGRCPREGGSGFAAVNLTRNQSTDQERYNENLLWLEGGSSPLPPVKFTRSAESASARGKSVWIVRDEHDMVNLEFFARDMTSTVAHALVVDIDYYIAFGEVRGYVRDEDGRKYVLDGLTGIGEDKSLLF